MSSIELVEISGAHAPGTTRAQRRAVRAQETGFGIRVGISAE